MKKITAVIVAAILLSACKKTILDNPETRSRISFHNASVELTTMLATASFPQRASILWDDIPPQVKPDTAAGDGKLLTPFFDSGAGATNFRNMYMYPNTYYNTQLPWVTYMTATPGSHRTGVTDSLFKTLASGNVLLAPESYTSVFFADSAGTYIIVAAPDEQQLPADKIRIRLAHMSPSNDTVFATVGKEKVKAFANGIHFRQVTAYEEIPFTTAGRLVIALSKKNDDANTLLRTFIDAVPGRSYTILFKGYTQPVSYTDRLGQQRNYNPNAELFIERMY